MNKTGGLIEDAPVGYTSETSTNCPPVHFADPDLFDRLEAATADELDSLPFGVVAMSADGSVTRYNTAESKLAGLTPGRVIGRNFFAAVAPCANTAMVGHRFTAETAVDDVVDYVFTFRLTPRNVRLRLLKRPGGQYMYLAVQAKD